MTQILIAEDEPRIASFLEKGLRSNGFVTAVADTGTLAASLLRHGQFDLLILDLGLPGKDGHQVLQELRQRGDRMPVIILTARDGVEDTVAGLDGGADDYVTKPFRFEELLARIRVRLRDAGGPKPPCCASATSLSTCAPGGRSWATAPWSSRPASSAWSTL
jgi:two-component system, OmpR family, response regulator QseB